MSNGHRIVFMRFADLTSEKLVPWREHCRRVVGEAPEILASTAVRVDSSVITWHLVSLNNRMLARSAFVYSALEDATSGATELIAKTGSVEIKLVSDTLRGLYGWYAKVDGIPVATCARWYSTERDRRQSIDLALVGLGAASLRPGVRLVSSELTRGRL
jgi:hypothetical protein